MSVTKKEQHQQQEKQNEKQKCFKSLTKKLFRYKESLITLKLTSKPIPHYFFLTKKFKFFTLEDKFPLQTANLWIFVCTNHTYISHKPNSTFFTTKEKNRGFTNTNSMAFVYTDLFTTQFHFFFFFLTKPNQKFNSFTLEEINRTQESL